ncbi:MAG TPA: CHAD domain-containing protein [Planctomycetaceae bacterium]|nr:CHAD domain-containing protein [Planctomycetaceae bacterium]
MPQFDKWIKNLSAGDPVCRVARYSLRARLEAVGHYLPLVAKHSGENIEHVHQLRVWTRRALAALDLFTELLPKAEEKWFRKTLHKIRRAAGKARDLDVLIDNRRNDKGKGAHDFLADLQKRRKRAQKPIVSVFHKVSRKDRFARQLKSLRKKTSQTTHDLFGPWARDKLNRISKPFFKTATFDTHNLSKLHRFRIRGKELRYAMELLAPAFLNSFRKKLYPVVAELQSRIGAIHDRAVAVARFEKWLAHSPNKQRAKHVRKLLIAEQENLENLLCEFQKWWTPEFESELHESFDRFTQSDGHIE